MKIPKREPNKHIDECLTLFKVLRYIQLKQGDLNYIIPPYEVIKSESPDFVVIDESKSYGIEITSSIPKKLRYLQAVAESDSEVSFIVDTPTLYFDDPGRFNKEAVKSNIGYKGDILGSYGWNGSQPEYLWAISILNSIKIKIAKLNSHYKSFDKQYLIINADSTHHRESKKSNDILKDKVSSYLNTYEGKKFDSIFIIINDDNDFIIEI